MLTEKATNGRTRVMKKLYNRGTLHQKMYLSKVDPICLLEHIAYMETNPQERMECLLKNNENAAPQGSIDWHNFRKEIVGGSELAKLIGCCDWGNKVSLAEEKLGYSPFCGSDATRWGNMFEEPCRKATEYTFGEIHTTGSVPGIIGNNGKPLFAASPDGLSVVSGEVIDDAVFNGTLIDPSRLVFDVKKKYMILHEFKVPHRRIPSQEIIPRYIPQVHAVADTCASDFIIFTDCLLRICRKTDYSDDWRYVYHVVGDKSQNMKNVLFGGFVGFYDPVQIDDDIGSKIDAIKNSDDILVEKVQKLRRLLVCRLDRAMEILEVGDDVFRQTYEYFNDDAVTFGIEQVADDKQFESRLESGNIYYSDVVSKTDDNEKLCEDINELVGKYTDYCIDNGVYPSYVMYYKIYKLDHILAKPIKGYVEQHRGALQDFQDKITELRTLPENEAKAKIHTYFAEPAKNTRRPPTTQITKDENMELALKKRR